jgi:hypothetical protein
MTSFLHLIGRNCGSLAFAATLPALPVTELTLRV